MGTREQLVLLVMGASTNTINFLANGFAEHFNCLKRSMIPRRNATFSTFATFCDQSFIDIYWEILVDSIVIYGNSERKQNIKL